MKAISFKTDNNLELLLLNLFEEDFFGKLGRFFIVQ
jgi:hypothetical protein